jgi:protein TonB
MKPTAVLLAVIVLVTATLFIAQTTPQGSDITLPQVSEKKDLTAAPLPQPDHIEANSPKTAKVKLTEPKIYTIVRKGETTQCGALPPVPAGDYSDSIIWRKVEIEAEYPGGPAAWQRFLNRNLRYPQEAIDNEISGSVVVQFVVDEEGNVSNIEAVSGAEAMCAEVMRVIRKSGKWTPAMQGGHYIKSLKKQPFMICLAVEE